MLDTPERVQEPIVSDTHRTAHGLMLASTIGPIDVGIVPALLARQPEGP